MNPRRRERLAAEIRVAVADMIAAKLKDPRIGFVTVTRAKFLMGTPNDEPGRKPEEGPRQEIEITQPFHLGSHEVTVGQIRTFVKATDFVTETEKLGGAVLWDSATATHKRDPAINWKNPGHEQTDNHPVVCVTWNDAQAFCRWLGDQEGRAYALPTEAQWEYACRAGTTTAYSFGDQEQDLDAHGWYYPNSEEMSHAVGQKPAKAWGLYDLHGNVWEWTADYLQTDYYGSSPRMDPAGALFGPRAMRGGSHVDGVVELRSGNRCWLPQDLGNNAVGFRVVCGMELKSEIRSTKSEVNSKSQ